ncbi:MAG: aldo/keto reductase [Rhodospirillales bacterium]|jgi:aryl-alcohol dehydrogenase-like predicted oxidoreductase|nr:aldo/keto reductase [Rhodospirillales bacterium]
MNYRRLGQSGLSVSEIGFGAWGIGGLTPGATSYGQTDDDESRRTLLMAMDEGINFFDTSPAYGAGHSETLIGQTLASRREKIVVATKGGCENFSQGIDFSSAALKRSLERSLWRLRTDYVDLFQLHSPPVQVIRESDELKRLVEDWLSEGQIRAFGVSVESPEDGLLALQHLSVDALQVNFNLVDQRALECGLFEAAAEKGVSIIARTPLCFGFLSGNIGEDQKFDHSDQRSRWSREQVTVWARAIETFSTGTDDQEARSSAQLALAFCLAFDQVATVIPGMMNETEVCENAAAARLGKLSAHHMTELRRIYTKNEFFVASDKPKAEMQ